jgi:hypothetical protein
MSTGSPITPSTSLARVQRFIELGKAIKMRFLFADSFPLMN